MFDNLYETALRTACKGTGRAQASLKDNIRDTLREVRRPWL